MESNAGVAAALISLERYQLGLDYYQRYPDLIKSFSAEEIQETARRYLNPDRLGIGIAGP
jgi:zinc protease